MLYNLENLTWQEFEQLVKFYLKAKIGEGTYTFDGTQDQGRDAIFTGRANEFPSLAQPWEGNWIFQVKHRTTRNSTLTAVESKLLSTLRTELAKIFLKHGFNCDNYLYIINVSPSNNFRDEAINIFSQFCLEHDLSNKKFDVIDYRTLEVFISQSSSVRFSFPALLRYTDIEHVFLKKEEQKNKADIMFAINNIIRFVSTRHYLEAAKRIQDNEILMLVGNPKSGKTTLVEALSLCFLDEGIYWPYFVRNADEVFVISAYLPENSNALFICDDIFGKHELDPIKLQDWQDYFGAVIGVVSPRHKFVFTTREYIYRAFERKSGLSNLFPTASDPGRYVLKLQDVSQEEREQILEKHLVTSTLSAEVIGAVFEHKDMILSSKDFSPEIIRSLVALVAPLEISEVLDFIERHIKNPNQYLIDFIENLEFPKKLFLLALAVAQDSEMTPVENKYLSILDDAETQPTLMFATFVNELSNSIIKKKTYLNTSTLEYYHPTMYDAVIQNFKQDGYYRKLMLKNLNLELFSLLTIRQVQPDENTVALQQTDFDNLIIGIERFINQTEQLTEVYRLMKYTELLNLQVPFNFRFREHINQLKRRVHDKIASANFFQMHSLESIEYWILVFETWNALGGPETIEYTDMLERRFRDYDGYDYWRLMFSMESIQPGLIEALISVQVVNVFALTLASHVQSLKNGLYPEESGKINTRESWYPFFLEIKDIVTRMKRSEKGKRLFSEYLLSDWQIIVKKEDTAKHRHATCVSNGWWKHPYKKLRNFRSMKQRPNLER